jgi:3-hydroxybutyryl-CoA dehydratase
MTEMTPGARLVGRSRTITEADLVSFAALTGDWHPQHSDAEWAAESRFGERIAHGMLVLSYSIGMLGFDPERVVALRGLDSVTFKRPVAIGETIRVEAEVEEATPLDEGHELVTLRWRVLGAEGKLAVRARVQVVHRTPVGVANGTDPEPGLTVTADGLYGDRVLL